MSTKYCDYYLVIASQHFSDTGIYNESILNPIVSFHVTHNFCVDFMNDLYEGVCDYDMCRIIKYFINSAKLFTLDTLNNR